MAKSHAQFAERYGRWAIVAGASEGVGLAAAEELAARGLNLLLIARNVAPLDEAAAQIRSEHKIEVRTLSLDLTAEDATDKALAALQGEEIGMLFYNAGAVHNSDEFLEHAIDLPMRMIKLNCVTPMKMAHALAPAMVKRGRGAIVSIGSMGCFVGSPNTVVYSAAKAFQVNFIEGLWAEIKDKGVDVFSAIIGSTNTAGRSRTLGVAFDPERDMTPEEVVNEIMDNLREGPTRVVAKTGWGIGPMAKPWSDFRAMALTTMIEATRSFKKRQTLPGEG